MKITDLAEAAIAAERASLATRLNLVAEGVEIYVTNGHEHLTYICTWSYLDGAGDGALKMIVLDVLRSAVGAREQAVLQSSGVQMTRPARHLP